MIKVKILKDGVNGADDGATVRPYPKDGGPEGNGVYVVSDALGEVMIEAGEAEEIIERKTPVSEKLKAKAGKASTVEKEAADQTESDRLAAEKDAADKAASDRTTAEANRAPAIPALKIPGKA